MNRVLDFLDIAHSAERRVASVRRSARARVFARVFNDDVDDDDDASKPDRCIARNDDDAPERARRKKK